MRCRLSRGECERADEPHHRFEAPLPVLALVYSCLASSYRESASQLPSEGTKDDVIEVPCLYSQGIFDEEPLPRVWCAEPCQVKQTLINHCQGIRHLLAVLLLHAYLHLLLRADPVRHCDYRHELRGKVFNHYRDDPVEPHRCIINGLGMGLQHCYI